LDLANELKEARQAEKRYTQLVLPKLFLIAQENCSITMDIIEVIEEVLDEYLQHCETQVEINQGGCYDFAQDVKRRFTDAEIITEDGVHSYLYYDGMYYDAENPCGVPSREELLFFTRVTC